MRSPLYSLLDHTERVITSLGGAIPAFGMAPKQITLYLLTALLAPFIARAAFKLVLMVVFGFFDLLNSCCLSMEVLCNRFTLIFGADRVAREYAGKRSSGRHYSYQEATNQDRNRIDGSPAPPEIEDPILEYCMVLGVTRNASLQDVRRAFRREIKKVHPDTAARENPEFASEACRRSRKVTGAYRALSEHIDRSNFQENPL